MYNYILNAHHDTPLGFKKWERIMLPEKNILTKIEHSLKFTFNFLNSNKLKVFRWKLIHHILACGKMLNQWRILSNGECSVCKISEDYEHLFIKCNLNSEFLKYISNILQHLGIKNEIITLKNIVFGYKITEKQYNYYNK